MIGVAEAFPASYAEGRAKFLAACVAAGLPVQTHPLALPGAGGEALAMDVAREGPADAERLLVVTSACHGVEGHCGSGVQVFALHDDEWRDKARAAGVAVLYVHALNPHGFSYGRRTTQENVDLNRNFADFGAPLPANPAYAELHALLLPREWPPTPANEAALGQWMQQHGMPAFQAAMSSGQYQFEDGVFFGGKAPTWSNRTLRQVLRQHGAAARRIAWIDLHTGLGPNGLGERIFACRDDAAAYRRASAWWSGGGATPVTSIYDGSSTSSLLNGLMWNAVYEECPQAEYTGIAMEYGTLPLLEVMQATRADHWLHNHPDAAPELAAAIRRQMREAFYTDTDAWKGQVISQARQAMFQAVDGLSGVADS
ncbi:M14 family metallopeptidase [Xenophilus azovorans]|uniref:M14 family metallopeptidase n=1 Tax=Xenophilus azovorans TaxID=151755 RepID=UPI0005710138|nr:M14 family metallopeptidase [Xenophilus azovorans]